MALVDPEDVVMSKPAHACIGNRLMSAIRVWELKMLIDAMSLWELLLIHYCHLQWFSGMNSWSLCSFTIDIVHLHRPCPHSATSASSHGIGRCTTSDGAERPGRRDDVEARVSVRGVAKDAAAFQWSPLCSCHPIGVASLLCSCRPIVEALR